MRGLGKGRWLAILEKLCVPRKELQPNSMDEVWPLLQTVERGWAWWRGQSHPGAESPMCFLHTWQVLALVNSAEG